MPDVPFTVDVMGAKYERWMKLNLPPEMVWSHQIREVARAFEENSDKSPKEMDEYVKVLLAVISGAIMSLEERVLRLEGVELAPITEPE